MDVAAVDSLSVQQRRCLLLVGQGKTTGEISSDLGIAEGTVNAHVAAGMAKLGAAHRRQAGYVVLEHARTTQQFLTSTNLPVAEPISSLSSTDSRFRDDDMRSTFAADREDGDQLGVGKRDIQPLKTLATIAVIVAALLIVILALKPLTESARDVANAVQPGRPH